LGVDANRHLDRVHVKTIILQNRNTRAESRIVIATRAALCRRDCARVRNAQRASRKCAPDVEPAVELALLLPWHFSPHVHKPLSGMSNSAEKHPTFRREMLNFPASNLHFQIYDHDRGSVQTLNYHYSFFFFLI